MMNKFMDLHQALMPTFIQTVKVPKVSIKIVEANLVQDSHRVSRGDLAR